MDLLMAAKAYPTIDQGADFIFTFELSDDNDEPIDLTGYTGVAVMRKHYSSLTGFDFDVDINESLGEVTLTMNAYTTSTITPGRYVYDCEVTDIDGKVSRIVEGIVTVTARVNK